MRSDIKPGGVFPDYSLPGHTNTVRKLSKLQGRDPLVLTLARGNYCPKEHQQHLELAANYPKIAVAYTQLVTITTDDHHTLQEFRASLGAQWTFLSDPGTPAGNVVRETAALTDRPVGGNLILDSDQHRRLEEALEAERCARQAVTTGRGDRGRAGVRLVSGGAGCMCPDCDSEEAAI